MAGRYLVTGVQLGMLKGMCEAAKNNPSLLSHYIENILNLIQKIEDKQFLGTSIESIETDVQKFSF